MIPNSEISDEQREAFWSKVSRGAPNECWPWLGALGNNCYGNVRINKRYLRAHRVAWQLTNFDIPDGYQICHVCDNPICCNPAHLMLGNTRSNFCDMVFKGRQNFTKNKALGTKNTNAKLTDEKVASIRSEYSSGALNQYELADKYGVTQSCIGCIIRLETWRHVA